MPDEILADLNLEKTDVSSLPGPARTSLVAYLLRWEYYSAAELCMLQLLDNHSHLVSVYDKDPQPRLDVVQKETLASGDAILFHTGAPAILQIVVAHDEM